MPRHLGLIQDGHRRYARDAGSRTSRAIAEAAFGKATTLQQFHARMTSAEGPGFEARVLLNLASSMTVGASQSYVATAHLLSLDWTLQTLPLSISMCLDLRDYLVEYWEHVSRARAFELHRPAVLARVLASRGETLFETAQLVTAAVYATAADVTHLAFGSDAVRAALNG
jgi:hypothetical protein